MIWGPSNQMAVNIHGLEIHPQTIGRLLREGNLKIPLSQRSYRWETEHVSELFRDMYDSIEANRDEYFVGSIVGIVSEGGILIYDGQQRLSTTMILIAAIRDYFFHNADTKTSNLVQSESLISEDRESHGFTAHFTLNSEDNIFFHNAVLMAPDDDARKNAKPLRESHRRILKAQKIAADFVTSRVTDLSTAQASKNLHRWLNFIRDSLRVIWVQVQDERTAFTIFETMNDRGLRLSAADLLKNRLYGIGDNRKDEIIQKWQAMTATIETIEGESENVVEYVRCYWITRKGQTRTKDLYDEIKNEATNPTKAVNLASDLEAAAQDYAAILLSSHEKLASRGPEIRTRIEVLRQLGVTQVRPLLLAAFRKFSTKEFDLLLDACVSWSVRTLLAGVPSGTLEGYYSPNAALITKGTLKTAADVKKEMTKVIPDDAKFKTAVCAANVSKGGLARYYLRALQRCEDNEPEPQYIPNPGVEITLEHILPSNPKPGEWGHFSSDDQKVFVNRLGNQALLTGKVNSKIGNFPYAVKKPALKGSEYSLTREASEHTSWGIAEINARQQKLADLAVKTWPLR